jgi:hypothetical protein
MSTHDNLNLDLAAGEARHALQWRDNPHQPSESELRDLFTPVELEILRLVDMWPLPNLEAEHQRKREAVAAVLRRYETHLIATTELLDEIIAAADTGI